VINNTDKAYQAVLRRILEVGKEKGDRTGTGTISIFSHTLEIDMADGFPLLTTKKMFTKGIIHELLWFLNGDTNIQYLVQNGVNIWTPDAYREYKNYAGKVEEPDYDIHIDDPMGNRTRIMTMDEFKEEIIHNDKFAERFGDLGPIYGKQWVNWGSGENVAAGWEHGAPNHYRHKPLNQIQNAIDTLKTNPDSRRIMVSAWNPAELDKMALPPCHWAFELYTEELTFNERVSILGEKLKWDMPKRSNVTDEDNKFWEDWLSEGNVPKRRLHLKWHQRSVDTFLGLPFNIASYGLLLEMIAQQCNMVPDKLVGDLTNVHIYKNHIEQCEEQLERQGLKLPTLELEKADSIFDYCYEKIKINDYSSHSAIKGKISV